MNDFVSFSKISFHFLKCMLSHISQVTTYNIPKVTAEYTKCGNIARVNRSIGKKCLISLLNKSHTLRSITVTVAVKSRCVN